MLSQTTSPLDTKFEFNNDSSSGLIGKLNGKIKTKDFIQSEVFRVFRDDVNHIPIKDVNYKREFLSVADDISRNKVRLVDGDSKDDIWKSKICFDKQNEAMKERSETGYIKYGFRRQYGGFNDLIVTFEDCCVLSLSDISGFDKRAWLHRVYELRREFLRLPKDPANRAKIEALLDFITYYTVNPTRLFKGHIFSHILGNSSGQNNTTPDNCILHLIICFDIILTAYYRVHGEYPTLNEFYSLFELAIYSDDKILGLNFYIDAGELAELEIEVYSKYGMTVKTTASHTFEHVKGTIFSESNKMEFLGCIARYDPLYDVYQPIPRIGKLATSLCKTIRDLDKALDTDQVFSKLVQIRSLSDNVDVKLREAISSFLLWMYDQNVPLQSDFDRLLSAYDTSIGNYDFVSLETGFESSSKPSSKRNIEASFIFFYDALEGREVFKLTMSEISKSEKKIKTLTEKVGCTEEGRLWLEQALDPFTDTPKRLVGFPDLITGVSVIQKIKQSFTYVVGTVAEDVHVFMDNLDTATYIQPNAWSAWDQENTVEVTSFGGVAPYYNRGGVVLRKNTAGLGLGITTTLNTFQAGLPKSYHTSGRTRVLAKGFEIHNTTPALSVGGAITVYRDSTTGGFDPSGVINLVSPTTTVRNASFANYPLAVVPETLAKAMLIPGAKQWEAKDGCYCVATMNSQISNPLEESNFCVLYDDTAGNIPYINATAASGTNPCHLNNQTGGMLKSPFFVSGAYMTGLPAETSLRINVTYIIERFVDQTNADLVVLATPSPYYDPVALELYARAAHRLPAGVKVDENDLGDWIKSIADVLQEFGMPGMPLVKGAVTGVQMLTGAHKKHIDDEIEKKMSKREEELLREVARLKANQAKPLMSLPKPKQVSNQKSTNAKAVKVVKTPSGKR